MLRLGALSGKFMNSGIVSTTNAGTFVVSNKTVNYVLFKKIKLMDFPFSKVKSGTALSHWDNTTGEGYWAFSLKRNMISWKVVEYKRTGHMNGDYPAYAYYFGKHMIPCTEKYIILPPSDFLIGIARDSDKDLDFVTNVFVWDNGGKDRPADSIDNGASNGFIYYYYDGEQMSDSEIKAKFDDVYVYCFFNILQAATGTKNVSALPLKTNCGLQIFNSYGDIIVDSNYPPLNILACDYRQIDISKIRNKAGLIVTGIMEYYEVHSGESHVIGGRISIPMIKNPILHGNNVIFETIGSNTFGYKDMYGKILEFPIIDAMSYIIFDKNVNTPK